MAQNFKNSLALQYPSSRSRILILLILIFFTSVSFAETTAIRLALDWKPEPEFGGFYAAQTLGVFAKHGLNVEILPGGAGTPVVQMLAARKVEFGIASSDEVIMARSHGADVVALFAVYQTSPHVLMTRSSRHFGSLAELLGGEGRLALQKGVPFSLFLEKKYPVQRVSVVPFLGGIANFLQDPLYSQQGFLTSEPLSAKKKGIDVKTFLIADEGFNPYTTVLVTQGKFLRDKRKTTIEMVKAVRSGWEAYLKDPVATNRWMQKLNPSMDIDTFNQSSEVQKSLIGPPEELGKMTFDRWNVLARQLKEMKLINSMPSKAEIEKAFCNL